VLRARFHLQLMRCFQVKTGIIAINISQSAIVAWCLRSK
jgi:hypothetical protein